MGLLDSIAKDEEELKALGGELPAEEEIEEQAQEEDQEDAPEEDTQEPPVEAAQPEKEEVKEPEKLDNAAYARLRREKEAAERKLRELEEAKAKPVEENADTDQEISEQDYYLQSIIEEKKLNDARQHLATLESQYREVNPDYDDVITQYAQAVASAYRVNNPRVSQADLARDVERSFIERAAEYYRRGLDPAEELYQDAVSLGFKKREPEKEEVKETPRKPDLDVIAKNKQKSAGMAGASRGAGAVSTPNSVASMPLSEFAKIPASELARIERGG